MAVGVRKAEPITAMRAVVRIEASKVVESRFEDAKGREQRQFALEVKVLSGAGDRDGEMFSDWVSFLATGEIGPRTKAGQIISACLGEGAEAETLQELAEKLVGRTFAAQIGTSRDGQFPRIQHDTITIAPAPLKSVEAAKTERADDEKEFADLPF